MNQSNPVVKASSIRRAITTLSKSGFITESNHLFSLNVIEFKIVVPDHLTQKKKTVRIKKTKLKN